MYFSETNFIKNIFTIIEKLLIILFSKSHCLCILYIFHWNFCKVNVSNLNKLKKLICKKKLFYYRKNVKLVTRFFIFDALFLQKIQNTVSCLIHMCNSLAFQLFSNLFFFLLFNNLLQWKSIFWDNIKQL